MDWENLVVKVHPRVGVPRTIAEKAVELARRVRSSGQKSADGGGDEVWAVFDRDEHPFFYESVAMCRAHGVGVARSNPCFEQWLILHIREQDKPEGRWALKESWERMLNELGDDKILDALPRKVEHAEGRAANQLDRRNEEGSPYGNPSTTVGELTGALRDAAAQTGGLWR